MGSAIFEDTEALQPKPKVTKLALESRLFTPGACVSKQGMERDLACSPTSQEAVSLPDCQLERHLIKGCPRQGFEPERSGHGKTLQIQGSKHSALC